MNILNKQTKEIYMYALGAIIMIGFFGAIYMLLKFKVPETNNDAVMLSMGALITMAVSIVAYFFGSSKGSADKNESIANMSDEKLKRLLAELIKNKKD